MTDTDGPFVAREFYERLFAGRTIDTGSASYYALGDAMTALQRKGIPLGQWATFIHVCV
jgi:hypothetical protein